MNRSIYFDRIEELLVTLATRIEVRGKHNVLNLNLHAENFYVDFLNLLFGWNLRNANTDQANFPGIDLVDDQLRIVAQVSSTVAKKKVSDALKKVPSSRKGYNFKFIGICKDASALRKQTFPSSGGLAFEPKKDIWDVPRLLKHVMGQNAETQKTYLEYLEKELGHGLERSERSGRLTDEALASAAGRLLDVGTPPDVATLFPDAPTSTTRAVSTLSEQSRVLKELDEESRRRSRSLSSLLDGTQSRHLILAPPGCGKTYWLWREAKQTLDDGAWFPVHIPISRFSDWKHVEERVLETTGVELDSLLEHPKSLLVLDELVNFKERLTAGTPLAKVPNSKER